LSGWPSTEKWARGGKLIAGSSRSAVSVNPTAVIASDESASATLHFTDSGTSADKTAWVRWFVTWILRDCADGSDERDEGDQNRFHNVRFEGEACLV